MPTIPAQFVYFNMKILSSTPQDTLLNKSVVCDHKNYNSKLMVSSQQRQKYDS